MPDSDTQRGSLPAFAIVIAALLGILVLILIVYLILNRKKGGESYSFLRRSKPKSSDPKWQVVYPPGESNPRPPPNVAPRQQPIYYQTPQPPRTGGPPQDQRNQHEESRRLLPASNTPGFAPREVELRTQPSNLSASTFSSRDSSRDKAPKVPGSYRQSPQYRLYQQQGNTSS